MNGFSLILLALCSVASGQYQARRQQDQQQQQPLESQQQQQPHQDARYNPFGSFTLLDFDPTVGFSLDGLYGGINDADPAYRQMGPDNTPRYVAPRPSTYGSTFEQFERSYQQLPRERAEPKADSGFLAQPPLQQVRDYGRPHQVHDFGRQQQVHDFGRPQEEPARDVHGASFNFGPAFQMVKFNDPNAPQYGPLRRYEDSFSAQAQPELGRSPVVPRFNNYVPSGGREYRQEYNPPQEFMASTDRPSPDRSGRVRIATPRLDFGFYNPSSRPQEPVRLQTQLPVQQEPEQLPFNLFAPLNAPQQFQQPPPQDFRQILQPLPTRGQDFNSQFQVQPKQESFSQRVSRNPEPQQPEYNSFPSSNFVEAQPGYQFGGQEVPQWL